MTTTTTYRCKDCGQENSEADTWLEPNGRNSHLGPPTPLCRDFRACWDRIIAGQHRSALLKVRDA